jgi:hypothetical protein
MKAGYSNSELRAKGRDCFERFLGAWSLLSCEHFPPGGTVLKPFGDFPRGLILYQAGGCMSAQLSVGSLAVLASNDSLQASVEEGFRVWREYLGYWGTFEVFPEEGIVVHRVEGSSFPNWIETEQIRHFRFDEDDRLTLEADTPAGHFKLVWRKNAR